MNVQYSSKPEPVQYMPLPDGRADVWIRQNIAETSDDDGNAIYTADEIYLQVTASLIPKEEIETDVAWWFTRLKDETEEIYADALCIPTVMADKRAELSQTCEQLIYAGIDVTLSSGAQEHFSLTEKDQINLFGKQVQLSSGATKLEYHQDGHPCKYYSATDMQNILTQALSFVSYHTTYCNSMFQWIASLAKASEIDAVNYGDAIPEEYQSEVLKDYIAQMGE